MGVGSNLESLLKLVMIREKSNCNCRAFAKFLDDVGSKWCETHFTDIIKELRNRAIEYHYPWNETVAKMFLQVAIKLSSN